MKRMTSKKRDSLPARPGMVLLFVVVHERHHLRLVRTRVEGGG